MKDSEGANNSTRDKLIGLVLLALETAIPNKVRIFFLKCLKLTYKMYHFLPYFKLDKH